MHPPGGKAEKKVHYSGRHLRFCTVGHWEYVERTRAASAVVVAALTPAGEVVFVEQYRPPVGANVLELPAGLVGDGPEGSAEDPVEAARRELLEESGFTAAHWEFATKGPISPGLSTESIHLLVAGELKRANDGGGVHGEEEITVHLVRLEQAHPWLEERRAGGLLVDPKVYAGLFFLLARQGGRRGG